MYAKYLQTSDVFKDFHISIVIVVEKQLLYHYLTNFKRNVIQFAKCVSQK